MKEILRSKHRHKNCLCPRHEGVYGEWSYGSAHS